MFRTVDNKLAGASLGERHKCFNRLLKAKLEDEGDAGDMLSPDSLDGWRSKSQADRIFIAKLANKKKDVAAIARILQSDNKADIAVALKATWMFEGTDINNAEYFIKQIFPLVSYHATCRIVSTLSVRLKNETLARDLYKAIFPMYGHNLAVKLLPKCSADFIRSQIMSGAYEVPTLQLKYIHKKDPALALEYLENVLKEVGSDSMCTSYVNPHDYSSLWMIILEGNPDLYMKYYKEFTNKFSLSLGKRMTRRIVALEMENILKDPKYYLAFLKLPILLKELRGESFDRFIMAFMADKKEDFKYCDIACYLRTMKTPVKIEYLLKMYAKKYDGASLLESSRLHEWNLARELPKQIMNEWGLRQLKNKSKKSPEFVEDVRNTRELSELLCLVYCPTEMVIPRYKFLMKSASDADSRLNIISHMVECCSANDDRAELANIIRFVASRFRNDQFSLRSGFLNKLNDAFKLQKLSAEHWKPIMEMINFMCLRDEIKHNHWVWGLIAILEQYVLYRLDNGIEIDSVVDRMIEYDSDSVNNFIGHPREFVVVNTFFDKYKKIILENADCSDTLILVGRIMKCTKRSKNKDLSFTRYDWLMDAIRSLLEDDSLNFYTIRHYLFDNLETRKSFSDKLLKITSDVDYFTNYIIYDSDVVLKNVDKLTELCTAGTTLFKHHRLFYKLRTYYGDQFAGPLREQFKKCCGDEMPGMLTAALSFVLGPQDNEILYKAVIPKTAKVDLETDGQQYKETEIVIKSFKYMLPPVSFETLWNFIQGDYLKFALPSVLSLVFFKPLRESSAFITQLIDKPVSVKKHGIRLAYFLYPREQLMPLYVSIWEKEPNASIREVVFQRTFKLFTGERDADKRKEIWEILKSFMRSFTESDKSLFAFTWKLSKVSPEMLSDYCKTSWEVLRRLESEGVDVKSCINRLTESFVGFAKYFDREFCDCIVEEYLNSFGANRQNAHLSDFIVFDLLNMETLESQRERFARLSQLFEKFIGEKWNIKRYNVYEYRQVIGAFVDNCITKSFELRLTVSPVDLLKDIGDFLRKCLPHDALFDMNVQLKLAIMYKLYAADSESISTDLYDSFNETSAKFVYDFGAHVAQYLNGISSEYGAEIHNPLVGPFKAFVSNFLNVYDEERQRKFTLAFVRGLLSSPTPTSLSQLLAVDLLSPYEGAPVDLYDEVVDQIAKHGNRAVKLYLSRITQLDSDVFTNQN